MHLQAQSGDRVLDRTKEECLALQSYRTFLHWQHPPAGLKGVLPKDSQIVGGQSAISRVYYAQRRDSKGFQIGGIAFGTPNWERAAVIASTLPYSSSPLTCTFDVA